MNWPGKTSRQNNILKLVSRASNRVLYVNLELESKSLIISAYKGFLTLAVFQNDEYRLELRKSLANGRRPGHT